MKRFLMLAGVAVVAAAMYVAASPASQQAKFAPERQVVALQKKVAALTKNLKGVKAEADAAVEIIASCYLVVNGNNVDFATVPVTQFGGSSGPGFLFGTDSTSATPRTALDVDTGPSPEAFLQAINPSCFAPALRHSAVHSASSLLQRWQAQHNR